MWIERQTDRQADGDTFDINARHHHSKHFPCAIIFDH